MMRFDTPYSRYNALLRTIWDVHNWLVVLVAINLLWLLMSFTILLFPAATAALYEVAYHAYRGRSPAISDYLLAVRHWLFKSWLWAIPIILFVLLAGFTLTFYRAQSGGLAWVVFILTTAMSILVMAGQFYFWSYMVIQENPSMVQSTRNAFYTVLGDPLLVLLHGGVALVWGMLSLVLFFPFVIIAPVSIAFLSVYSLMDWLYYRGLLQKIE
jgi:hypothetical protein